VVFSSAVFAAPIRIAVADFKVASDNTRLKYVGKGFAEMISAELAMSKAVMLIDRDRRAAILGEMEFSLSGAVDEQSQARIGKLLSADYLVFGEIIDMDAQILITCRIVRVETGEVAWTDKILGPLSDYDAVSMRLASSALKELGGETAATVAAVHRRMESSGGPDVPSGNQLERLRGAQVVDQEHAAAKKRPASMRAA
jgi:TolB-like protein